MNRIAAVVATLALAGTSFAATINVPGDHATIQGAIDASSNGDVIAIEAGTYQPIVSLYTDGKAITIGSASGNLDVTIDGQNTDRVFTIVSEEGAGAVIKDLVITGGSRTYGGGILCVSSNPTISNCTIEGNTATYGGGIYCDSSNPTISNCTISGNTASVGGGIDCHDNSNPTISNCTIEGNTATIGGFGGWPALWGLGGGIACDSSNPTISNCTISGNTASDDGGGIFCGSPWSDDAISNLTISDCTIDGNTADAGGGIYCEGANPTITTCTIEGNTAYGGGGGIFCLGSNPTISNCTISGNTASDDGGDFEGWWGLGGGIACDSSNPTISNCTISGNTASDDGGGIFCYDSDGHPTISGSQICGNTPNQIYGPYTASWTCIEQSCDTCAADSDADGVPDYLDQCPGEDDTIDTDSDGTPDCIDGCPDDPLKSEPGDCGCGELETDTDSDGTPDCIDGCPDDPLKTEPEMCGCGTAETNVNGDVDCDGDYDIDDIYAGMEHFGIDEAGQCAGDTDGNGVVNIKDLLNMLGSWGACP